MPVVIEYKEMITKKPKGSGYYKLPRFRLVGPSIDGLYTDGPHQVCRDLLKKGFSENQLVRFMRGKTQVFEDASIGDWAKWTLSESDGGKFYRSKYQEFPEKLKREEKQNV